MTSLTPNPRIGNRNAVRHGLRSGSLPKGAAYIKRECDTMRNAVEDAVLAAKGEINLYDAATIQTAMRWERHAMLAQRWLRHDLADMDAATRLMYSRDIARASAERDKCLERLGLHKSDLGNVIDALYAPASAATSPTRPIHAENGSRAANDTPSRESPAIARVGDDTGDADK